MKQQRNFLELLSGIDPSGLSYQEWLQVGMALHHEGYSMEDWDLWSWRDPGRYHPGECAAKWNSFHGNANPVTGGTLVQMAREHGWIPAKESGELDWDSPIASDGETSQKQPDTQKPEEQLIHYLEVLFKPEEHVGYVTQSYRKTDEKGTRWLPRQGHWDRTAGQLIKGLKTCGGDIGSVIGDYPPMAGAWIRFNPLDGHGCTDKNVADYRYALVESDDIPVDEQTALIQKLRLPVACLVYSGGRSIHAIAKVGAKDAEEYDRRVRHLYQVCEENGLKVDTQNKNPSRLSRMPGVMRAGKEQKLLATNIGEKTWDAWVAWMEQEYDGMPEPESLIDAWDNLPDLAPCLIDGVLRKGHKMLIAGPSKAGKSVLLTELCIAIAEGKKWLGWDCAQGRVLYINLELDRASCLHRFKDVYQALGWKPGHLTNVDVWNLRGKAAPMDKLAPKLIRRAAKKGYAAVVIDPIYKVITGDENSADQMANFCNYFDQVCTELECAVIYCHHHSKGSQGAKKSMDRASGSGVFARDPDALLDLIELEVTDALSKQEQNKAACRACLEWLKMQGSGLEQNLSQDDKYHSQALLEYCRDQLDANKFCTLKNHMAAAEKTARLKTAWRIEGTLREFPRFEPINVWFDYPVHTMDEIGVLQDTKPENEKPPWQKKKKTPEEAKKEKEDSLRTAFEASDLEGTGKVKLSDICDYMGKSPNTIKKYVDESKDFKRINGIVEKM